MLNYKLKINEKNTEFLIIKTSINESHFSNLSLSIGNDELSPSITAKNPNLNY